MGSDCSMATGSFLGGWNVLELSHGGGCKYTKTHQTVHMKMVNITGCELYFNEK